MIYPNKIIGEFELIKILEKKDKYIPKNILKIVNPQNTIIP